LRRQEGGPLEKLAAATTVAALTVMQLVAERDRKPGRPLSDAFDPDDQPVLERVGSSLEGKTAKQKNPHPKGSLAFASWVFARLGGWTGDYGKPDPIVMLRALTEFHAIKHGWSPPRCVNRLALRERGWGCGRSPLSPPGEGRGVRAYSTTTGVPLATRP